MAAFVGFGGARLVSQVGRERSDVCVPAQAGLGRRRRAAAVVAMAAKSEYKITALPGDGIGPEITAVTLDVLKIVGNKFDLKFDVGEAPIGGSGYEAAGDPLPDETLAACKASDSCLLAAIGGYKWDSLPREKRPESGLLRIRKELGLFANLRPAKAIPQLLSASTLKEDVVDGVDIMVVRELTGGIYFGTPKGIETNKETGERTGFSTMVYSESEVERIAKVGFEIAQKRRSTLCSVDKANVLDVSQLWRDTVIKTAESYPDVTLSHMYVDNAAMQLIRWPKQFDTIVTGNMFGDILSDECSVLFGSLGMLPSASLGDGSGPGLFEPVHGSAPDIAGQDKANPLATVLSAAMMLRYDLDQPEAADFIEESVEKALDEGFRTSDIMSEGMKLVGCKGMGEVLGNIMTK